MQNVSAAHGGQPCSQFKAFALAHKGKATSDVDFNPEDPPPPLSAYSNATIHSRISQYTSAAREIDGQDWDPSTHDLDGEIVMRASMEAKMEKKLREERERYEQMTRSMLTYFQSTGALPPPPDQFPGLAGVPPPVGTPPVGNTLNQSEASNIPISPISPSTA
ncbi:hypothetical protein EJB05_26943, partial [Eragrostis curvula]